MQITLDLISMFIGISLGGLITWLFVQSSKAEGKQQDRKTFEKIFSLEKRIFIAYNLLKWFRRPNKKKKKYKENENENRTYQNLFNYFLKNKLLEKVSGDDPVTFCLTKEGEKICNLLDEFSELLEQSITKQIE
jgi:predicted transcriptional regulator